MNLIVNLTGAALRGLISLPYQTQAFLIIGTVFLIGLAIG